MCVNEILREEQIILIRYFRTSDRLEMDSYRERLGELASRLKTHPYDHRPYLARSRAGKAPRPSGNGVA